MPRYISEFSLPQQGDAIYSAVTQKILDAGYTYTDYEYEKVFKKGNNIVSSPCFIKLTLNGNVLKLQAWLKTGVGIGVLYKELKPNRELKRLITDIEEYITQNEGESIAEGEVKTAADEKEYPDVQKPCSKDNFVKKYAPKSIIKEFTASAIMVYILSAFSVAVGYVAQDMRVCIAFVVVLVLAAIMHVLKNTVIVNIVASLGCLAAILYTAVIAYGFNDFILYNFELRPIIVGTIIASALFAALWVTTAVSMFVTAYKLNKFYKRLAKQ